MQFSSFLLLPIFIVCIVPIIIHKYYPQQPFYIQIIIGVVILVIGEVIVIFIRPNIEKLSKKKKRK